MAQPSELARNFLGDEVDFVESFPLGEGSLTTWRIKNEYPYTAVTVYSDDHTVMLASATLTTTQEFLHKVKPQGDCATLGNLA